MILQPKPLNLGSWPKSFLPIFDIFVGLSDKITTLTDQSISSANKEPEIIYIIFALTFSCQKDKNLTCNHCLRTRRGRFESPFVGPESLFCSLDCLKSSFQSYHCFESKIDLAKMLNGNPSGKVSEIESPSRRLHLACRLVSQKVFLL